MSKQLMQELLIETIGFYDSEKRSIHIDEMGLKLCAYENVHGNRCAVGRIMTDEAIKQVKEDDNNTECGLNELLDIYGCDILLEKWRPLLDSSVSERTFLYRMQSLHDDPNNWTSKGLSISGEDAVRSIARYFDLDWPTIFAAIEKRATS